MREREPSHPMRMRAVTLVASEKVAVTEGVAESESAPASLRVMCVRALSY